jgi:excisionase family DNA binding protein
MSHHKPNIIKELRSMLPRRPLDMAGARAVAEAQALRLLQLLDIKGPAVDVGLLTTLPRISVEVGPDLQGRYLSGESGWDRGRWLIRISRKDSLTRRRFTLAHEFKHILDGPAEKHVYGKLGVGDEDDRGRCIEEIADYFAASFLMPRTFLCHAIRQDIRDVHRLAAIFEVSLVAMNRRLRDLGLRIERPDGSPGSVHRWFRAMPIRRLAKPVAYLRHTRANVRTASPHGGDDQAASSGGAQGGHEGLPVLLTVPEACTALRVSKWMLYRLMGSGQLGSIKVGRRRLIPMAAIAALVDQLLPEGAA